MGSRLDKGCLPPDQKRKIVYRWLSRLFAPRVFFDPLERFFPVDLLSAVRNSSLWQIDPNNTIAHQETTLLRDFGRIDIISDLQASSPRCYTTVAGTGEEEVEISGGKFTVPVPQIDKVYTLYAEGKIPARLTIYATVCQANRSLNNHLVNQPGCKAGDPKIKAIIAEGGLILNYYMYFPAYESDELISEGDWSGVSILLKKPEIDSHGNIRRPENLPVLACYYKKTISWTSTTWTPIFGFEAGEKEFRRWEDVEKDVDSQTGLVTHPMIYVSLGRHNCYFEPIETETGLIHTLDLPPLGTIENGDLTPGPSDRSITGSFDWSSSAMTVLYSLCPPLLLVALCATGCELFEFDPVVDVGVNANDRAESGGYLATSETTGSGYPDRPANEVSLGQRDKNLELVYVDLDDEATKAIWTYEGAWGGATALFDRTSNGSVTTEHGFYQGFRRPRLSSWFMWNLFCDWTYGCAGTVKEQEPS